MGALLMLFDPNFAPKSQELGLWQVRQQRNALLAETDWTQMPDSPLSDEQRSAWETYRQALRDMTTGLVVPFSDKGYIDDKQMVWPEKPQ